AGGGSGGARGVGELPDQFLGRFPVQQSHRAVAQFQFEPQYRLQMKIRNIYDSEHAVGTMPGVLRGTDAAKQYEIQLAWASSRGRGIFAVRPAEEVKVKAGKQGILVFGKISQVEMCVQFESRIRISHQWIRAQHRQRSRRGLEQSLQAIPRRTGDFPQL